MTLGRTRKLAPLLLFVTCVPIASAAQHGAQLAELVAHWGDEIYDRREQIPHYDADTNLVRDGAGRLNIAETSLNYAAALVAADEKPERAHAVIEAVLATQATGDDAARGLFPWYLGGTPTSDATLYLGPTLAWLAQARGIPADLHARLQQSAKLALEGLLAEGVRPREGFGLAMWAGSVASLGAATGDSEAQRAAADGVRRELAVLKTRGPNGVHSPTYDALRIGGLRWAWQHAADDAARAEAGMALRLRYLDMLQRYEPTSAIVAGAIGSAYEADYLGSTGVARYLLACDLPSALAATEMATPLAMYFALSEYTLPDDLVAVAEGLQQPREVRTRTPSPEEEVAEEAGTCTWLAPGISLGTMSGQVDHTSIPILATSDAPERPTSYFYIFGGPATVHSAQAGPLAICSFNFDAVGTPKRLQAGLQGILGPRDQIDRVIIGRHEWIGEPEAVGGNLPVVVQRGSTYVGVKILEVAVGAEMRSPVKPGRLSWLREGNMDSLSLVVFGRHADYPLKNPLYDVRVGLLVEVAPIAQFESLDAFAEHVSSRRVTQRIAQSRVRVDEQRQRQIPGRHELTPLAEIRFLDLLEHTMMLEDDEGLSLGLVEELAQNRLLSRTVPAELPNGYLWYSPELTLTTGADIAPTPGQ